MEGQDSGWDWAIDTEVLIRRMHVLACVFVPDPVFPLKPAHPRLHRPRPLSLAVVMLCQATDVREWRSSFSFLRHATKEPLSQTGVVHTEMAACSTGGVLLLDGTDKAELRGMFPVRPLICAGGSY